MKEQPAWWMVDGVEQIDSPALLLYPARIRENVKRMVALAGGPQRLRPHVKTHKLAEVVRIQIEAGIEKFKCATIAEAEMLAASGAKDILLAYQPVGPKVQRLIALARAFPAVQFSALFDDPEALKEVSAAAHKAGTTIEMWLDVDCGMHRTGIVPGPEAADLYAMASKLSGIRVGGLHAYDGHIVDRELIDRIKKCDEALAPVFALRDELESKGVQVPRIIAGGTPTFPIHAQRRSVECAPGTCVFWDASYLAKVPDLDFLPAALVLTRVVSKPGPNRLCLDLGHKAVASENPHPRVQLMDLHDATAVSHSEEHLVIETPRAGQFKIGDCIYGIPWHICPTVALYSEAVVVNDGRAEGTWKIAARARQLRF